MEIKRKNLSTIYSENLRQIFRMYRQLSIFKYLYMFEKSVQSINVNEWHIEPDVCRFKY